MRFCGGDMVLGVGELAHIYLLVILESYLISLRLSFIPCPMGVMESKPSPLGSSVRGC